MADTNDAKILHQFKKNLTEFIDELISQLPQEAELIISRVYINDQVQIKNIMVWFVNHLVLAREQINERDELYFISNNSLFSKLNSNNVNKFRQIWESNKLDEEEKKTIWKWIDSFVFLADKYKKTVKTFV